MAQSLTPNQIKNHMERFQSRLVEARGRYTLQWIDPTTGEAKSMILTKEAGDSAVKAGTAFTRVLEETTGPVTPKSVNPNSRLVNKVQVHLEHLHKVRDDLDINVRKRMNLEQLSRNRRVSATVRDRLKEAIKTEKALVNEAAAVTRQIYESLGFRVPRGTPTRELLEAGREWVDITDPEKLSTKINELMTEAKARGFHTPKVTVEATRTLPEFVFRGTTPRNVEQIRQSTNIRKQVRSLQNQLFHSVKSHANALTDKKGIGPSRLRLANSIERYIQGVFSQDAAKSLNVSTMVRGNMAQWEKGLTETYKALSGVSRNPVEIRTLLGNLVLAPIKATHFGHDANALKEALSDVGKSALGMTNRSSSLALATPVAESAATKGGLLRSLRSAAVSAGGAAKLAGGALGLNAVLFGPSMVREVMEKRPQVQNLRRMLAAEAQAAHPANVYEQIRRQELLAQRAARLQQSMPGLASGIQIGQAPTVNSFGGYRVSDGLPASGPPQQVLTAEQVAAMLESL